MHKIDGAGHVANSWVPEDIPTNRPPTEITSDWMNAVQEELVNVVEGAGLTLNKPDNTQLLTAINRLIKGGDYKDSVRVATDVAINLAAPGAVINGVAMVAGDRFLDKDNATLADRGIYIWNGAAVPATRALDADTGAELNGGAIIPVESGTENNDTNWQITNDGVVTIGVTGLTFDNLNPVVTALNDPAFANNSNKPASTSWVRGAMSAIAAVAGFSYLFAANGYVKFPDWLGSWIVQWGAQVVTGANTLNTFNYPLTYPTAAYQIVGGSGSVNSYGGATGLSASQFRLFSSNTGAAVSWLGFGK